MDRKKMVAKLLKSKAGRKEIAAAMTEPLKLYRDYEAVARRALLVDPLGDGEIPYYDKDIDTNAVIIGEDGRSVRQIVTGVDRVNVPLFEVATNVEIPYTQMKQRRYDLESRVKVRTKIDIFRAEDRKIFNAMIKAVDAVNATNPTVPLAYGAINFDAISDTMGLVERHGSNRVTNIFINGKNTSIIRKVFKDLFEPVTVSEIVQAGVIGVALGAKINISPEVPEDRILMTAEPEFVGRLVESISLTVLNADNPGNRAIGFSVFENIGVLIQDHAIASIKIV